MKRMEGGNTSGSVDHKSNKEGAVLDEKVYPSSIGLFIISSCSRSRFAWSYV